MAIDANVAYVEVNEDGSGTLHLCDRVPEGSRGQSRLRFESAPYEVTALNGLSIWGGSGFIMLGDKEIAKRHGYTRISFIEREPFNAAVAEYHSRKRAVTLHPHQVRPADGRHSHGPAATTGRATSGSSGPCGGV